MSIDREKLVNDHLRLPKWATGKFLRAYPRRFDSDDVYSAALEGLWKAANSFNPTAGPSFPRWAIKVIFWTISQQLFHPVASQREARLYEVAGEHVSDDGESVTMVDLAEAYQAQADEPMPDWEDGRMADVRRAVARLPKDERRVIELRFLDGFERAEVAATLGVSQPTVRRLTFRAVARLRRMLPGAVYEYDPLPRWGNHHGCPAAVRNGLHAGQ